VRFRIPHVAAGFVLAASSVAAMAAQPAARTGETYYMPYETRYWSYAGVSVGRSDYDIACPIGFGCDRRETGFKLFAGGKSNEFLGLEASYVYLGKANRGGGDTWGQGLNLSLVGTFPVGQGIGVNGKIGGIYGWTKTEGFAPGMPTGRDHGLGLSYGVGLNFALTPTIDLRLDWDRYRLKFETGRDDVDLASIGVAFRF
jgi:OmpA-OmpF porin, OOP family